MKSKEIEKDEIGNLTDREIKLREHAYNLGVKKGSQSKEKEMLDDFKKSINEVHKHWHPINTQGAFRNEKCNKNNCPFRHLEFELKQRLQKLKGDERHEIKSIQKSTIFAEDEKS